MKDSTEADNIAIQMESGNTILWSDPQIQDPCVILGLGYHSKKCGLLGLLESSYFCNNTSVISEATSYIVGIRKYNNNKNSKSCLLPASKNHYC